MDAFKKIKDFILNNSPGSATVNKDATYTTYLNI
jgi:hypothetical protein